MEPGETRRYFPPPRTDVHRNPTAEDLHAWSIYRQNVNSELSTSALGSNPKALPYGNFALRPSQVDAILHRAKGANNASASSELLQSTNAFTYLKFGLPRVSSVSKSPGASTPDTYVSKNKVYGSRSGRSPHAEQHSVFERNSRLRKSRSEADVRGGGRRVSTSSFAVDRRPNAGHYSRDVPTLAVRSPSEGDINRLQQYRMANSRPPSSYELPYTVAYRDRNSPERRYVVHRSGEAEDVDLVRDNWHASREALSAGHAAGPPGSIRVRREALDTERNDAHATDASTAHHNGASRRTSQAQYAPAEMNGHDSYVLSVPQVLNEQYFLPDSEAYRPSSISLATSRREELPMFSSSLQVRSLSYCRKTGRKSSEYSFSAVTFEAKAGDLVGILATSHEQGDDLLQCLIDRRGEWGASVKGAITLNGVNIDPAHLSRRAVFAGINLDFNPCMSLKQTLLFASHLAEPGEANRRSDTKGRIEALIGDLGLSNVSATSVGELTRSEKQRLNIACQLLADPDVVLLDRPTYNMDIFDTFFLIEYLRQWALHGRIVIVTVHPPTFEIFNMLARVIVLADGRTIYSDKRKDMVGYFQNLEYPCPNQKNPADYYLDLVSVDDTSEEAREESIQRIEYLSSVYAQRHPALSDVDQPGFLPAETWRGGFLWQVTVLWIRALIFMFPYNLMEALHQIVQNAAMSIMIGVIYFGLGRNQSSADDRTGLLYVILTIGIWPILIHIIHKEYSTKRWLYKDLQDRTYSKACYLLAKMLYSIPITTISLAAYIIPVYFMSRLRQDDAFQTFGIYIGVTYLHSLAWRAAAKLLVYACPNPRALALPLVVLAFLSFMTTGYPVHNLHIWRAFKWFEWISPAQWAFSEVAQSEFLGLDRFDCLKIPIQIGGLPILTSPSCGVENGRDAINYWQLASRFTSPQELWKPFMALGLINVGLFLLAALAFLIIHQRPSRTKTDDGQ